MIVTADLARVTAPNVTPIPAKEKFPQSRLFPRNCRPKYLAKTGYQTAPKIQGVKLKVGKF